MMEFECTRTSNQGPIAPCPEAYGLMVPRVDVRCTTAEEYDQRNPESPWLSKGSNHRTFDGRIIRDMEMGIRYFVTIETLEDFVDFVTAHGQCVVGRRCLDGTLTIEIYDDYRE